MFHKNLDQASKRYKGPPNVAAIYTSLPKVKANGPERNPNQDHLPKVRDFAYEQHDPVTNTSDFIANFADFGFQSHHIRVNNGDVLSKAGVLGYEKKKQIQDCPKSDTTSTTTVNSVSSSLSSTTDTLSIANNAITEPSEERKNDRKSRGIRDKPLLLAVAICMLEYMN